MTLNLSGLEAPGAVTPPRHALFDAHLTKKGVGFPQLQRALSRRPLSLLATRSWGRLTPVGYVAAYIQQSIKDLFYFMIVHEIFFWLPFWPLAFLGFFSICGSSSFFVAPLGHQAIAPPLVGPVRIP